MYTKIVCNIIPWTISTNMQNKYRIAFERFYCQPSRPIRSGKPVDSLFKSSKSTSSP